RLPRGWASEAQRRWAATRAAWSAGTDAARHRAATESNVCMMVFLSIRCGGPDKPGGQLRPARPVQMGEGRVQPRGCKTAPPGPAVGLAGSQGRPGGGGVPVVELMGGDGLPFADE